MDIFVTLVHGLNLAAIYGLMAIGISLLWSSIGMINMAHGATFAVSGYAAWLVADLMKPVLLAVFGKTFLGTAAMAGITLTTGAAMGALFGALIYALAFLPIHDKPNFPVRSLIVTLAINLATVQLLLWYFGPKQKNLPKIFGTGKLDLGPLSARYDQIGAIAATVVILGLVLLWLKPLAVTSRRLFLSSVVLTPSSCSAPMTWMPPLRQLSLVVTTTTPRPATQPSVLS